MRKDLNFICTWNNQMPWLKEKIITIISQHQLKHTDQFNVSNRNISNNVKYSNNHNNHNVEHNTT